MAARKHRDAMDPIEDPNTGGGREDELLSAVLNKLPEHGPFHQADRDAWLKLLTMALDVAYGSATAAPAPAAPAAPPAS